MWRGFIYDYLMLCCNLKENFYNNTWKWKGGRCEINWCYAGVFFKHPSSTGEDGKSE